jgi:uncharacterized RDD family membrane protein YckC/Tfp pilus assembly major pilin PilA
MYAGFWKRSAAAALDIVVLLVPMVIIGIVAALLTGPRSKVTAVADMAALLVPWLYFAAMESGPTQATVGKLVFGLRVVGMDGQRLSFLQASTRFWGKILSVLSLGFGFLMVGITHRKQALHDVIARCLVLNRAELPNYVRNGSALAAAPWGRRITALVFAGLMIAIASGAAAIAVPAYRDHIVRTGVDEALQSGRGSMAEVAAYMVRHNRPPRSLEEARAVPSSPQLRNATITKDGAIVLTLAVQKLEGKRITLMPTVQPRDEVVWTCTSNISPRYLPRQCQR